MFRPVVAVLLLFFFSMMTMGPAFGLHAHISGNTVKLHRHATVHNHETGDHLQPLRSEARNHFQHDGFGFVEQYLNHKHGSHGPESGRNHDEDHPELPLDIIFSDGGLKFEWTGISLLTWISPCSFAVRQAGYICITNFVFGYNSPNLIQPSVRDPPHKNPITIIC